MVEFAKHILPLAWPPPMVHGAAEEHEEHAHDEEYNAKGPLPAFVDGRPHHPDGGEGEDGADEMSQCIATFVSGKDVAHRCRVCVERKKQ